MGAARTHIYLGVGDADESSRFYEALLGGPPATRSGGRTVFEMEAPPLVLTLERHPRPGELVHNRFALDVPAPEHVGRAAVALRRAGARLRLQDEGIEANDPDGNVWKVRFVPRAKGRSVVAIREERTK